MSTPRTIAATMLVATTLVLSHRADSQVLPLLDQSDIRAPLAAGCQDKPDDTPLPVDPRHLVVPGVNQPGTAVQFNAYYVDLHDPPPPFVKRLPSRPTTCGDWRASVARGKHNLETDGYFLPFATASGYHNLWRVWGLPKRPADFDEQVLKRLGLHKAPYRNPYPLPGEDPNKTNGGSGQLPLGLMQYRELDGRYTGLIQASCSACHDSRLGDEDTPFTHGRTNDMSDLGLVVADLAKSDVFTLPSYLAIPIPWSVGRGSSDALGIIDFLPVGFDMNTLDFAPSPLEFVNGPAGGMTKAPSWWQRAFKTRQFWDGALTSDNVHSEMAFGVANILRTGKQRREIYPQFEDINNFLISLSPPKYPGAIDIPLAEQGAVIFHERDLWANGANAGIPKQPGNGSCASCHGVYSPRYAADPRYLPDPRLKGIAGVVTPIETIRTDPARYSLMLDERKRRAWNSSWWAYNELSPDWPGYDYYKDGDILASEVRRIERVAYNRGIIPKPPYGSPLGPNEWIKPEGYIAPPLYGTWALAPYLHNGAVPDLWSLLKSSDRPGVWKRQYTAPGSGFDFLFWKSYRNEGYDSSYAAYDLQKLGWKYTSLPCNDSPLTSPFLPCTNGLATLDVFYSAFANAIAPYVGLGYQVPPPISDRQIKSRMIMNTHLYSLGNEGHTFSDALSDSERWAVIEYLKTL